MAKYKILFIDLAACVKRGGKIALFSSRAAAGNLLKSFLQDNEQLHGYYRDSVENPYTVLPTTSSSTCSATGVLFPNNSREYTLPTPGSRKSTKVAKMRRAKKQIHKRNKRRAYPHGYYIETSTRVGVGYHNGEFEELSKLKYLYGRNSSWPIGLSRKVCQIKVIECLKTHFAIVKCDEI